MKIPSDPYLGNSTKTAFTLNNCFRSHSADLVFPLAFVIATLGWGDSDALRRARVQRRQAMTPQNAENALYEKWRDASPEERPAIERTLFAVVSKHAQKVISRELAEDAPELVANIAGDVIEQLARGRFRGECVFSTWAHEIALRKIGEELRRRTRRRKLIDDRTSVDALEEKDAEEDDGGYRPRQQIRQPNFDAPILLDQVLSPNDRKLARLKLEGLTSEEIGVKLGITHEAVDSRWRRLQTRIRKTYPK